jgi:hypothetical protein
MQETMCELAPSVWSNAVARMKVQDKGTRVEKRKTRRDSSWRRDEPSADVTALAPPRSASSAASDKTFASA